MCTPEWLYMRFYGSPTDCTGARSTGVVEEELLFAGTGENAGNYSSIFVVFTRSRVRGLLHAPAIRADAALERQKVR
jgi:hypothetical protein